MLCTFLWLEKLYIVIVDEGGVVKERECDSCCNNVQSAIKAKSYDTIDEDVVMQTKDITVDEVSTGVANTRRGGPVE